MTSVHFIVLVYQNILYFNVPQSKYERPHSPLPVVGVLMSGLGWTARVRSIPPTRSKEDSVDHLYMTAVHRVPPTSSQHCLLQPRITAPQGIDVWHCCTSDLFILPHGRVMNFGYIFHKHWDASKTLGDSFCLKKICECSLCHLLAWSGRLQHGS